VLILQVRRSIVSLLVGRFGEAEDRDVPPDSVMAWPKSCMSKLNVELEPGATALQMSDANLPTRFR
jgi:hypothetical protein